MLAYLYMYIGGAFNKFPDFLLAFKMVIYS